MAEMCGRLNITDDPAVQGLMRQLRIPLWPEPVKPVRFARATDTIPIIREIQGQRRAEPATWWLLLDKTDCGFKPSRYTSFNTRYDKLDVPRSAGFKPFRETRCIIPAKGFGETQFVNKKPIHYYDFEAPEGEALAFGGLYREWFHPQTGEVKLSCSVITLRPHEKLKHIHNKAMPLILPQQDDVLNAWLDPNFKELAFFAPLLQPHIPQSLIAYPIDKPSTYQRVGEIELISADVA
jgi:putative SOS response-associated peptidase YedK